MSLLLIEKCYLAINLPKFYL